MTPERRAQAVSLAQDSLVVAGIGLASYGAGLAWRPAGFMVCGIILLVMGLGLLGVRGGNQRETDR